MTASQAFTLLQLVVKRADRSHLSGDSQLTQASLFRRLRGQAMMVEGLCAMFLHHRPYFLVIIRIIVGETWTAAQGVRLETSQQVFTRLEFKWTIIKTYEFMTLYGDTVGVIIHISLVLSWDSSVFCSIAWLIFEDVTLNNNPDLSKGLRIH